MSYASLLATQFRGFRHFGVIGGVGILLLLGGDVPGAAGRASRRWSGAAGCGRVARGWRAAARHLVARLRRAGGVPWWQRWSCSWLGSLAGAAAYLGRQPYETDFKNLRSSGAPMREAGPGTRPSTEAFGRGVSGGTVIALPTAERAREVAGRLRAADAGKPASQRLFARVRRWTSWSRPIRPTSWRCWPTFAAC